VAFASAAMCCRTLEQAAVLEHLSFLTPTLLRWVTVLIGCRMGSALLQGAS
jgi:hypothetical protein